MFEYEEIYYIFNYKCREEFFIEYKIKNRKEKN